MNAIYRHRNGFAAGPALLMLAALQVMVMRPSHGPDAPAHETIEILMLTPPPEAVPPPPPPPPQPQPKQIVPAAVRPLPAAVAPSPVPVAAASIPDAPSVPAPPVAAPPVQPPPAPAPPIVQPKPTADLEAAYVARLRQMLNAIKRYPTGREASLLRPTGVVRVWLILDREGRVLEKGIETSSQSLLLDTAALKTVSLGSYPAFPEDLWPGQARHRFHADIDFIVPNG